MVRVTNVVCMVHLKCEIDLKHLVSVSRDVTYNPRKHNCLIWKHKKIGGCCMISKDGRMMCNGAASSIRETKKRVRQYAQLVQKAGYPVHLSSIQIVTMSAVHTLSQPLNLRQLARDMNWQYEPELFPALMFQREGIHFTCFKTGKVIITGIKKISELDSTVVAAIIELELLIYK